MCSLTAIVQLCWMDFFQLARLRDSEIARMRMEEKEASRKELEQMKKAVCPLCTVSF